VIGEVYPSTSTKNKIDLDVELRNLIKIEDTQHVIMLVGLPDGLERHYQNVLAWGGTLKNLTIVDISPETIMMLENHHDETLSHYDRPSFVVSDFNDVLESWDSGQIGVIDFDGTTGIKADYHLRTLIHAERLLADYLIVIGSARKQDPGMIAFGEKLPFVDRKVYVSKEEQEKTRGAYHKSFTKIERTYKSAHGIFDALIEGRGHDLIKSKAYQGVSPMVISAIKLSKVDPQAYLESVKHRCMCCGDLFSEEWKVASKEYNLADASCDIETQLKYQQLEKIKELFKCPRDRAGKYFPTDEWWIKHDPENFNDRHPERYRMIMCKKGTRIRPCSFTSIELAELKEAYNNCLAVADGDHKIIKQMVETYCKNNYRDYNVVQLRLSKLGLWVKLNRTGPKRNHTYQEELM
jgi:hypothetical protein